MQAECLMKGSSSMLKELASLWIGPHLGPIEQASIRSFLGFGHKLTVFSYDHIGNCPEGVIQRDAREIIDLGRIIRHHRTQSAALHSDFFRYALLVKSDLVWVDLDIVALRPFDFPDDYIFGYEAKNFVNCAVLRLPKDSPALMRLAAFDPRSRGMPPGISGLQKLKLQLKNIIAGGLTVDRWPWGSVGPKLVTEELKTSGEIAHTLPIEAFYSVPLAQARIFAEPDGYHVEDAPANAYAVHLWASNLKRHVNKEFGGTFPKDSFVAKLCRDA